MRNTDEDVFRDSVRPRDELPSGFRTPTGASGRRGKRPRRQRRGSTLLVGLLILMGILAAIYMGFFRGG